jgi:hypothetical protein
MPMPLTSMPTKRFTTNLTVFIGTYNVVWPYLWIGDTPALTTSIKLNALVWTPTVRGGAG